MNKKIYNELVDFIKNDDLDKIKEMIHLVDIHHTNDYLLYVAVFHKKDEICRYFIDLGMDPETTAGRLSVAYPERLEELRQYKRDKATIDYANALQTSLPLKAKNPSIKI